MTVGTKSVLFGAHCFLYHWLAVAFAWWKLYRWAPPFEGARWPAILDPRVWFVFFVHDFGYLGLPDMDGPTTGERHPEIPAILVSVIFDRRPDSETLGDVWRHLKAARAGDSDARRANISTLIEMCGPWGRFSLLHSRYYAKIAELQPSRLCCADKLALTYTPWWLYLPGAILSGEIEEYLAEAQARGGAVGISTASKREWFETMRAYAARWAYEHADGRIDTWTGDRRSGSEDTAGKAKTSLHNQESEVTSHEQRLIDLAKGLASGSEEEAAAARVFCLVGACLKKNAVRSVFGELLGAAEKVVAEEEQACS